MFTLLAQLWAWGTLTPQKEIEEASVDVVIATSYCSRADGLTQATQQNLLRAIYWAHLKDCLVAWSPCDYALADKGLLENRYRLRYLQQLPRTRTVIASCMNNTVEEAVGIKDALTSQELPCETILVITGRLHARSARYIWQKTFPTSRILVEAINEKYETEIGHPVRVQRNKWVWFAANIARQCLLWTLPLSVVGRLHHQSSQP